MDFNLRQAEQMRGLCRLALDLFEQGGYVPVLSDDGTSGTISRNGETLAVTPRYYRSFSIGVDILGNAVSYAARHARTVGADGAVLVVTCSMNRIQRAAVYTGQPVRIVDIADMAVAALRSQNPALIKRWSALRHEALSCGSPGAVDALVEARYLEAEAMASSMV